jgi:hypothetical protein
MPSPFPLPTPVISTARWSRMAAPASRGMGYGETLAVPSVGPCINRHLIYEKVSRKHNLFSGEPEALDRHRFTPTEFFRTQGVKPVAGASVRFSHTEYEVSAFPATGNPGWRPPLPRREGFLSRLTSTPGQSEAPPRMFAAAWRNPQSAFRILNGTGAFNFSTRF